MHDRQREAGINAPAVDDDRAGAALTVVAALLGAGEVEMLALCVEQGRSGIDVEIVSRAVNAQRHLAHGRHLAVQSRKGRCG
jgi:hypothetical protein